MCERFKMNHGVIIASKSVMKRHLILIRFDFMSCVMDNQDTALKLTRRTINKEHYLTHVTNNDIHVIVTKFISLTK